MDEYTVGDPGKKTTQNSSRKKEKAFGTSFAYRRNEFPVTKLNMNFRCDFLVFSGLFRVILGAEGGTVLCFNTTNQAANTFTSEKQTKTSDWLVEVLLNNHDVLKILTGFREVVCGIWNKRRGPETTGRGKPCLGMNNVLSRGFLWR